MSVSDAMNDPCSLYGNLGIGALCIWREARGESYQTKLAVAYSIMNRVSHPKWWGTSLIQVVGKLWQYSSMTAKGDPNLIQYPPREDDPYWQECLKAMDSAYFGKEPNPVPGADSYHDTSIQTPAQWGNPRFVGQVGHMKFFDSDNDFEGPVTGH